MQAAFVRLYLDSSFEMIAQIQYSAFDRDPIYRPDRSPLCSISDILSNVFTRTRFAENTDRGRFDLKLQFEREMRQWQAESL